MPEVGNAVFRVVADFGSLTRAQKEAKAGFDAMSSGAKTAGAAIDQTGTQADKAAKRLASAADAMDKLGTKASIFVSAPIIAGFAAMTKAASDLGEAQDYTNRLFGQGAQVVNDFSKSAAGSFGLSRVEVEKFSQSFAGLLSKSITDQRQLAASSVDLTKRVADIGSALNISNEEVAASLRSFLAGETEAGRRLNIVASEVDVAQEGIRLGLAKTANELSQQDKVLARYSIAMRETSGQAGNFGDTLGISLPNQMKKAKAEAANVSAELGQNLLPIATRGVQVVAGLTAAFGALPGPAQTVVIAFVAMLAAAGPLAVVTGRLITVYQTLGTVWAALRAPGALAAIGSTLGPLAVALGPIAIGFAAMAYGADLVDKSTRRAADSFGRLTREIKDANDDRAVDEAAQNFIRLQDRIDEGTKGIEGALAKGFSGLRRGVNIVNPFADLATTVETNKKAILAKADELKRQLESGEITIEIAERIILNVEKAGKDASALRAALAAYREEASKAGVQSDQTGAQVDHLAERAKILTDVLKGISAGIGKARDSIAGFQDDARAAAEAPSKIAAAEQDLADALAKGETARRSATEAERDALQARLDGQARARELADAEAAVTQARTDGEAAAKAEKQAEDDLAAAKKDLQTAATTLAEKEQRLADVLHGVSSASKEAADATADLRAAQLDAAEAALAQQQAADRVVEAEKALADLQQNGQADLIRDIAAARRDQASADADLADAERDLADALAGGPQQRAAAQNARDLAAANDDYTRALQQQSSAAADLATAQANLERVLHGVDASSQAAADAVRALTDAQRGAQYAELDLEDAKARVTDLEARLRKGDFKTPAERAQAERDLARARLQVKDAEDAVTDARKRAAQQQQTTDQTLNGAAPGSAAANAAQAAVTAAQNAKAQADAAVAQALAKIAEIQARPIPVPDIEALQRRVDAARASAEEAKRRYEDLVVNGPARLAAQERQAEFDVAEARLAKERADQQARTASDALTTAVSHLSEVLEGSLPTSQRAKDAAKDVADAQGEYDTKTRSASDAQDRLTGAQDEAKTASGRLKDAQAALKTTQDQQRLATLNARLETEKAEQRNRDKAASDLDLITKAQSLANAYVPLIAQQQGINISTADAATKNRLFADALRLVSEKYPGLSSVKGELQNIATATGSIPKQVPITVTAETAAATSSLRAVTQSRYDVTVGAKANEASARGAAQTIFGIAKNIPAVSVQSQAVPLQARNTAIRIYNEIQTFFNTNRPTVAIQYTYVPAPGTSYPTQGRSGQGSTQTAKPAARGSRARRGEAFVVGDNPDGSWNRTTEMFVPGESGRILSNAEALRAVSQALNMPDSVARGFNVPAGPSPSSIGAAAGSGGGAGGNSLSIVVNNPAPEPASDSFTRGLYKATALGILPDFGEPTRRVR